MANFGGIVFEHGQSINAVVIDDSRALVSVYKHPFALDPNKGEEEYREDFKDFFTWLNKQNAVFSYFGPKLSGSGTGSRLPFQKVKLEPGDDSKAFMAIIGPLKKKKRITNRKRKAVLPSSRAVIELFYEAGSNESSLVYAILLALRERNGAKSVKLSDLVNELRALPEYLIRVAFINMLLTQAQGNRPGFAALKKAVAAWNNPNKRQLAAIAAITDASLRAEYARLAKAVSQA